jgi:hypothetical protein
VTLSRSNRLVYKVVMSKQEEPGPAAADVGEKRLLMSEIVASINDLPVYTGRSGLRRDERRIRRRQH